MPKFFLNFGGPGGSYFTTNPARIPALDKACQEEYTGAVRAVNATVKGINITVHTYGVHRALTCEIPDDAPHRVRQLYDLARYTAENDSGRGYALTSHNCVTSVARVLNVIDPRLTPSDKVNPWGLDSELKDYCGDYGQNDTRSLFVGEYQKVMREERFSLMRIRTWPEERIDSLDDIIKHSYGRGKEGSGERTKSTLIRLGWVTEDKKGLLIPTMNAPADFRDGLDRYNEDFAKVQHLKSLYKKEASVFSFNKHHFFDDNPDYATAIARLEAQQRRNPDGASAKVLKTIAAEEEARAQAELPSQQLRERGRGGVQLGQPMGLGDFPDEVVDD